ncbi:hypothetical protein INR75_15235 [Zunongwangia sp. SCSIO 43204]|uniref:hypothetical protein n=1 Tax=Zunongwangia sp. SCSIO 43204 TaxID=2779359 RepID=UPI001CA99244|nr:hypothetical protein [Zunongwangia sp. SCSIO 43204]UAB83515.1 hypothetical protein INR75_15235 [Zunongwangia sp. SCSIO 43204]
MSSWTGLVENKSNIWFHPARNNGLETLELAPFPYIQYPLRENKIWRDALKINNHWSNFTAMNWKDSLVNQVTYVISGKKLLEYNNNEISCWIIDAKGSNRIGESFLTSYFNEELGFIKFEYKTIENKQIVFTLQK